MSAQESDSKFIYAKKLDAAERQLETAIWLWFNDGDLVSINTLAGAAYNVLDDLLHHHKKGRAFPIDTPPKGKDPKKWRNSLKQVASFAKHARIDPGAVEVYDVEGTALFLFFVLLANVKMIGKGKIHGLRSLFALWFRIRNPEPAFDVPSSIKIGQKLVEIDRLKKLSRAEFFQEFGGEFVGNPPRPNWRDFPAHKALASKFP